MPLSTSLRRLQTDLAPLLEESRGMKPGPLRQPGALQQRREPHETQHPFGKLVHVQRLGEAVVAPCHGERAGCDGRKVEPPEARECRFQRVFDGFKPIWLRFSKRVKA